jgi:copper chaperone CopZ
MFWHRVNSQEPEVTLAIQGMHCAACASAIAAELETIPGVHHVKASYAKQNVSFQYDGASATLAKCKETIVGLGYRVQNEAA